MRYALIAILLFFVIFSAISTLALAILMSISAISVVITVGTFIYSMASGRSYGSVCDTSDYIYYMNRFGLSSLLVIFILGLFYMIYSMMIGF